MHRANTIPLQQAVFCTDCETISASRHDVCEACGSRSLFNLARMLGGKLAPERAVVIDVSEASVERLLAGLQKDSSSIC